MLSDDEMLTFLDAECLTLRCVDLPTGGGDANIGWEVVQHLMGKTRERIVGRGSDPRAAISEAHHAIVATR